MSSTWTQPSDVLAVLRRRWDRGVLLSRHASGETWDPVSVALRGPDAQDLQTDLGSVQAWVARWRRAHPAQLRLQTRRVSGKVMGVNEVPCRVWVDTEPAMWALLGVRDEVARYDELVASTLSQVPYAVPWMRSHPKLVLDNEAIWERVLGVLTWVSAHDGAPLYLRQVDVVDVDTKFLESHRRLLSGLLDELLPPGQVNHTAPRGDLAARYGFLAKPDFVRIRTLDPSRLLPGGFSDLSCRVQELAAGDLSPARVLVVENEITYLSLPELPDAVAILGGGYGLGRLGSLAWLGRAQLSYWGDLDTHGFAILDGLRAAFPEAQSLLMDAQTLVDHRTHWVTEPNPTRARLTRLTDDEQAVYQDLVTDRYSASVRLEQERIRFSAIRRALSAT